MRREAAAFFSCKTRPGLILFVQTFGDLANFHLQYTCSPRTGRSCPLSRDHYELVSYRTS